MMTTPLDQASTPDAPTTLQAWRLHILNGFLLLLFSLGTCVALVDIASFINRGTLTANSLTVLLGIIGIITVGIATFNRMFPYALRAGVPLALLFLIGLVDVLEEGINADGRYLFLLSVIFSVVFFGGRTGWAVFALSITLMSGRLALLGPGQYDPNLAAAITDVVIFTFFSAIAAMPAARLIYGLTSSTHTALLLTHEAEEARQQAEQHAQEVTRNMQALVESRAELAETQAQRNQTEQLMQARSDAVRAVVHDLNHTVQGIQSALDVWLLELQEQPLDAAVVASGRDRLEATLAQQRTLLHELRDAALLESGTLVLQPIVTDFGALVQVVARQLQPRYDLAECALTVTADDDLPAAWCDLRRMQRVVYNVLENAFRYTTSFRDDGVVPVCVISAEDELVCMVQDNGRGIAPTDLKRLGQKFARLARGEGAPDGMGLGLNFAIGIMRLSRGALTIDSPGAGQGTTVTLRLPRVHESQLLALEYPHDRFTYSETKE